MKILVLALLTAAAFGQAPSKPADTTPPKAPEIVAVTHEQETDLQLALKDFEIAQLQGESLKKDIATAEATQQKNQEKAQTAVADKIAAVKKQLKLDETWDYDFSRNVFVKKAAPVSSPAPPKK